jgi:hypothetical protein
MKRTLSLAVAAVLCTVLWPAPRADASLSQENLRSFIQRVGAKIDSSKGGLFVTSMASEHGRVEIRLLNDAAKQRLGLYAYGFGNATNAKDQSALYEYLLQANSELGIGSFFVDKDKDIGYKFLLDTRDPLSFDTFSIVYLAMVNVIADRRPEIAKMLNAAAPAERPADSPQDDSATPNGQPVTAPPVRARSR